MITGMLLLVVASTESGSTLMIFRGRRRSDAGRSTGAGAPAAAALISERGWQLLRSERAADRRDAYVIEAQKGAHLAVINLQHRKQDDTSIIVVWRKA
jgi:hypothetical protein